MSNISKNTANLSPEERRSLLAQLLREKTKKSKLTLQGACIHQLFESQVERKPEAVAVVFDNQQLTYRELNQRANKIAHHLQTLGVKPEVLVGICMDSSLEMVVGLLGILKAGGAYLPLDPRLPQQRLALMLAETKAPVLLSQQHLLERLPEHNAQVVCLDSDWDAIAGASEENPISSVTAENLAYVIYSSRRGVLVEHHAVGQRLDWLQNTFTLSESDAVLHQAPLDRDTAVWEIFWPLVTGGRLVIAAAEERDNPAYLQHLIATQKVSIVGFVPSALSAFITSSSGDLATQLSSLRLVLCSGEPLKRSLVEALREHFTDELHNLYSLPETAGEVTSFACQPSETRDILPIGHPTHKSVYVLDKHLQPMPVGVKGEIYVGGTSLARGYLQTNEETASGFVENPFSSSPGTRLFKTGELGRRLNDGTLELVGSVNRQTWLEGFRVELQEVEAALLATPGVEDARVLARCTETSVCQLVAYVVLSTRFSPEQLQSHLQALLPAYMLPCTYEPLSALPLTEAGQVDEQALGRLEVIDPNLVQRWEEQLRSLPEIEQVAVVVQEQTKSLPPLHLSDLLPDWKVSAVSGSDKQVAVLAEEAIAEKSGSNRPAISNGEPLQQKAGDPTTLSEALQRAALQMPAKGIAYIQSDGSESSQSYEHLLEEAQRILAGLRNLGLKPQDKVIFQLERNQDFIPAFWGCILGGFIPVPISVAPTYNPANSTVSKLHNTWQMLDKPIVLTSAGLAPVVRSLSEVLNLENFQVETIDDLRGCHPDRNWHISQPDDLAILLLTSGSTGIPKAVMQSHRSLLGRSAATAMMNNFTSNDVSLNWFPLDHVGGLVMFHLRDVYLGCQQIQAPTELVLQQPTKWLDWISHYRATITWAPNFAYGLINAQTQELALGDWDLSSLRFLLNGGEAIVAKQARKFLELLAPYGLPATAMHPAWGMSETCSGVAYSHNFSLDSTTDEDSFVEVGAPIPGFAIRIVDAQDRVVEEETIGRVQVKGVSVTSGYYQNPEINREVFTDDGWFTTGDLGFLREGCLTLTGREKDVIIINGLNYYSHELEAVVEEVEGVEVSYTAAVGVRSASGNTDKLVIFFNAAISNEAEIVTLIKEIRSKLVQNVGVNPDFLVPLEKEAIPKTAIGKIQRSQLKNRFEADEFNDILKRLDLLTENANTLPDWFYQKIWCQKEASPLAPVLSSEDARPLRYQTGVSLVFLDRLGLGTFLCGEFNRLRQSCVSVEAGSEFAKVSPNSYRINPHEPDHYRHLLEFLAADNLPITQILHLWTYDEYAGEVSSLEALEQAQDQGIYSLLFLVQALAKVQASEHSVRLQVISSHAQLTLPADKIAYEKSTLIGLLKTIPLELPWLQCRHIDLEVEPVQVNAEHILRELRIPTGDSEIAYRNSQRLISSLAKVDMLQQETQDIPLKQGGIYLVTGGLGGIGTYISQFLIKEYGAKLIIVGRTELPSKTEWSKHLDQETRIAKRLESYQEIEATGGDFIYEAVDICDKASLQKVVARASSKWNQSLSGIFHLAGEGNLEYHWKVSDKHWVAVETPQTFDSMLRPKVHGTWTLYQLIKDNPQALFISFSSVNGVFGGATFSAYSAANSFLDCCSLDQRYNSHPQTYCFNWSIWDDLGMSQGNPAFARDAARDTGYHVISKEQGLSSLLAGLYRNQTQLIVGLDGSNRNIRRNIKTESDGIQKLTAYFIASNGSPVASLSELRVRDRFGTKSTCDFVQLEEMPLADTGAIDREQLITLGSQGRRGISDRVAPRTEVERQLANIWQEVLSVPQVGIHDNFFELGGHSLLATQLISRVREAFAVELPLRSLFESPSIAELSKSIEATREGGEELEAPAITPVARDGDLPLSFAQTRLWFLDQLEGGSATYNVPAAVQLNGSLNVAALEQAIEAIVQRHEVLRTNFPMMDGVPVQVIAPTSTVTLPIVNLQDLPEVEQSTQVERLANEEAQRPFDLSNSPLVRVTLLRLGEQSHVLLVTMHHIVSDGWSVGIFIRELSALYQAFSTEATSPLPELPIQYADFAHWQRQSLSTEVLETQLNYWKQQLAGVPPILELPTVRARPPVQTFQGSLEPFELNPDLTHKLKILSQHSGATLFMTLLAAFVTLLSRYSSQEDIVVGSPIANRNHREIESLIGFFVNTLVLRTNLKGNPSFSELLTRVQQVALDAYAHQDVPFEQLVEALQPERSLSHSPLFQVMFVLQNAPMGKLELLGLTLTPLEMESVTAKFDLTLAMTETDQRLHGVWEYNTDLFEAATIRRMIGHFQTLLEEIVSNPQQRLSEFPLLTDAERHQLLVEWNDTQTDYPQDQCIHQLFEEQAERTPDAVAVVFGDQQLTYRELNCRANQLAHHLQTLGVEPEVLVGICIERSLEMVVGLLGILKAGGAYVPLEPTYPKESLSFRLSDARVSVLLTKNQWVESLPEQPGHVVCLDTDWEAISQESQENPVSQVTPDRLAYVMYTSGSTGTPKGVSVIHRGVVRLVKETNYVSLSPEEVFLQLAPISFDASTFEIWGSLLNGARLVVMPAHTPSLQELGEALRQYQVTTLWLTAGLFHLMVDERLEDLKQVRQLLAGGDVLSVPHVQKVLQELKGCRLVNGYGPTENTTFTCCYSITEPSLVGNSVPIGRPISNTQVYLLDRYLQPVPIGVPGELYIGGAGLARGYFNCPELTAERFIPNPFNKAEGRRQKAEDRSQKAEGRRQKAEGRRQKAEGSDRLYKTGDLARYLPDGNIEFLGRIDNQVKIRGFRIELEEIEALLAQHPEVREAVVIAREDHPGNKRLVAYIVPDEQGNTRPQEHRSNPKSSELRRFLKETLPDYMVPAAFVMLDVLPLTPNGKVDRRALPAPAPSYPSLETSFVPPRNPTEEILAAIWSEVLGVEQVGIHDNFFELGGDSILSIQIIARANQAGLQLTPKQLFQHQAIAELAAVASGTTRNIQAEQGLVTGLVPLTPIQHWFFEQNLPEPHHWNQAFLLEVPPELDRAILERVVQHLLVHHDALRLRFVRSGSDWQQVNAAPNRTVPFSVVDLSAIAKAEQASALEAAAAELQTTLNLSQGPLVQVALFALGDKPSRLLIVIHHLAVDGVSWRILLEDLETAYQQLSQGKTIQLPPKTTSFKHWAEQLRSYAQSNALESELAYWLAESWGDVPSLPTDFAGGANTEASARTVSVSLNVEETSALLQEVPRAYNTQINDILLTALVQVFAEWTGFSALLINLEGHGREDIFEDVDLSRTVGWFTALFPVLLELEAIDDLGDALKSLKEQLRNIPNKGIGYGLLRYLSGNAEVASKLQEFPQAQVSFNYLGQFDRLLDTSSLFQPAQESIGSIHSLRGNRNHLLDVTGLIVGGQLRIDWTYSENLHQRATVERLAGEFVEALRSLITHCLSPDTGGYTPSDFPLTKLNQDELDKALASIEFEEEAIETSWKNIEELYPLSPMQQGMLFHTLYAPESGVYFEQLSCTFGGNLDVQAFQQAWQQVVARHQVLRTAFIWQGQPQPLAIVGRQVKLPLEIDDWRSLSPVEQQQQLEALLQCDRDRGFQLSQAPLMRLALIQMGQDVYQFVWSHHHLLMDGWSLALVLKEVFDFYKASCQGQEGRGQEAEGRREPVRRGLEPLPTGSDQIKDSEEASDPCSLPVARTTGQGESSPSALCPRTSAFLGKNLHLEPTRPYRDYIAWLQKQDLAKAEVFWRQVLKGFTVPTPLVVDGTLTSPSESYSEQQIQLSVATTEALQSFARQHQLTVNTLVQGAWALLLSRYSGEADVVFGVTVSGRPTAIRGVESIVGLFINTLPMRVQVSEEDSPLSWLKQIQNQQVEMSQYEYPSLVQIQGWSEVPRGLPLFESIVVFENYPVDASLRERGGNLELGDVRAFERTNYPITVVAGPGEQLSLRFKYDGYRFDAATIARMAGHFQTLLEGIVANSNQRLSDLPMLSAAEQQQLLVEWNDTKADYPLDVCIYQLFEAQVERTPDAVAVVFEHEQLTYRELNTRANQLAHHLQALGVKPDVLVAICVERSVEMVVGLLGILKAGGAYVPLDPAYPSDRLVFMLEDAHVSVLLTQQHLVERLPIERSHMLCLDEQWESIARASEANPESSIAASDLAYVIYTSGSTGKPKGVAVEHRSLLNLVFWHQQAFSLSPTDRATCVANAAFDAWGWEVWPYLAAGASIHFPDEETRITPTRLRDWLLEQGITISFLPTPLAQRVLALDWPNKCALRTLLTGGDKLQQHPLVTLPFAVVNNYGPTENTVVTTSGVVAVGDLRFAAPHHADAKAAALTLLRRYGFASRYRNQGVPTIGRPIANTQVYVLNRHLQPVPVGVPGELYIGGAGLARGYFNRADLTAEKFIPNPFSKAEGRRQKVEGRDRLYKTGDLVRYRPDGNIEFLDRIDHQVKIRGFRIELGEIETAIAQHPHVRENIVIDREDVPGNKQLVAYVVPDPENVPTLRELRSFLKDKLPEYMVPSAFVFLESLPLTPNGKVDRRALPMPDMALLKLESTYVAPRTPLEEVLAGIWADVLEVEQVGVYDDFFELGGHSLLATQIVSQVQEILQVELALRSFFETHTVADLAALILRDSREPAKVERTAELILSLTQLSEDEVERMIAQKTSLRRVQ